MTVSTVVALSLINVTAHQYASNQELSSIEASTTLGGVNDDGTSEVLEITTQTATDAAGQKTATSEITTDGQTEPAPINGTVTKTIETSNGSTTTVTITNNHTQTSVGSSSKSSLKLNTNSSTSTNNKGTTTHFSSNTR